MSKNVTIEEADGHLGDLIKLAEQGEDVVIVQNSQPKARLVAVRGVAGARVFGQYHGKIAVNADFDVPLPDDFWLGQSV